jgi:dTDP-4-dehydrorhamnose 3,5-epimerase
VEFRPTDIPGCFEVVPQIRGDERGRFVKVFHEEEFAARGLATHFAEQYHSTSVPGVVRGLHFQLPPADHAKLVYCIEGAVLDVAVDLRRGSPAYGRHVAVKLSTEHGNALYLPRGVAHGFCTPRGPATLVYNVETVYAPEQDTGIRWDSAGIDWPVRRPVVSERDAGLPRLEDFDSPFTFAG